MRQKDFLALAVLGAFAINVWPDEDNADQGLRIARLYGQYLQAGVDIETFLARQGLNVQGMKAAHGITRIVQPILDLIAEGQ